MSTQVCSVVIPSYNRRATLELVLQGLEHQTLPSSMFEVIVVLDGGTDNSAEMLADWQRSKRLENLRWFMQPNSGQAAARNSGAQEAVTPVVVFLDDDVVPDPQLLAVHMRWHSQNRAQAVLGDYRLVREQRHSLYHLGAWAWWEDKYYHRALPGRQPGYRDFCTGNVSLRRVDFMAVGGFDTAFRGYGGEDYELGYRLQGAGVALIADRNAQARHYHRTTVAGVLHASRQEAYGDVLLGRKHPELRPGLRLARIPDGHYGLLARLALHVPHIGDRMMAPIQHLLLPLYERAKMRKRWRKWFDHLRGYAYWRGVRDVFGSWRALMDYQLDAPTIPEQHVDISDGLPEVLPPIWVDGPSRVIVTFRGQQLGTIWLHAAIEVPIREYLARQMIEQLSPQLWLTLSHDQSLPWSSYLHATPHSVHADGLE